LAAKRATSSSLKRVRIGRLSALRVSAWSLRKRLRSLACTSMTSPSSWMVRSTSFTLAGKISSV
jgi:hypothetical protein